MLSTILRLSTSSRSSLCVQRVIGRPDNFGDSHATAKICATCSAVTFPGDPGRGASDNTSRMASRSRCGSVHSQAHSESQASRHRRRQTPTWLPDQPHLQRNLLVPQPLNPQHQNRRTLHNPLRHRARPTEFLEHNPLLLANPDLCRLPWQSSPPCLTIEGMGGVHEFSTSWNPISVLWH